eukprot:1981788-Amphidinium_carterae.1
MDVDDPPTELPTRRPSLDGGDAEARCLHENALTHQAILEFVTQVPSCACNLLAAQGFHPELETLVVEGEEDAHRVRARPRLWPQPHKCQPSRAKRAAESQHLNVFLTEGRDSRVNTSTHN